METTLEFQKLSISDTELMKFVAEERHALKWKTGMDDIECHVMFSNLYIAKLDGVPIGCICFKQYSKSYYTCGIFIVKEEYREQGYGLKLIETIKDKIDYSQNISCFAVPQMMEKYKRIGFEPQFLFTTYLLQVTNALKILKTLPITRELTARDPSDVNEEELLSYDTTVFGYKRHAFILKWIYNKHNHSKVVVKNNGDSVDIVGYVTARTLSNEDGGYVIGPLFANSIEAAYVLLTAIFETLQSDGGSSSETVSINCPVGKNSRSKDLIDVLQASWDSNVVFATTKGLPEGCMEKWFSVTCLEI